MMNVSLRQKKQNFGHKTKAKRLELEIIYLKNIHSLVHTFCDEMEREPQYLHTF